MSQQIFISFVVEIIEGNFWSRN